MRDVGPDDGGGGDACGARGSRVPEPLTVHLEGGLQAPQTQAPSVSKEGCDGRFCPLICYFYWASSPFSSSEKSLETSTREKIDRKLLLCVASTQKPLDSKGSSMEAERPGPVQERGCHGRPHGCHDTTDSKGAAWRQRDPAQHRSGAATDGPKGAMTHWVPGILVKSCYHQRNSKREMIVLITKFLGRNVFSKIP